MHDIGGSCGRDGGVRPDTTRGDGDTDPARANQSTVPVPLLHGHEQPVRPVQAFFQYMSRTWSGSP